MNLEICLLWVYTSELKPLYTAFLHSVKLSGYRTGIKFDKNSLALEENNYPTKIVNAHIVCDLDAWLRNPTNSFKLKNGSFGATNIVKIVIKKIVCLLTMEQHLMEQANGILIMTLLGML